MNLSLTSQLALFFQLLCRGVAAQHAGPQGHPSWWGRPFLLPAPAILLIYRRLCEIARRVAILAARFEAGTLRARAGRAAVARTVATRMPRRPAPRWPNRLRNGFAWLPPLAPGLAPFGTQLAHLLRQPEMARLLAAAPQLHDVLRPLCRMLGVAHPPDRPEPSDPGPPADAPATSRTAPPNPVAIPPATLQPTATPGGNAPPPRSETTL